MDQRVKGWLSLVGRVVAVGDDEVLVVRAEQAVSLRSWRRVRR
jgi:hypothetical protein